MFSFSFIVNLGYSDIFLTIVFFLFILCFQICFICSRDCFYSATGVLCNWRITDQVCLGQNGIFLASMTCVKVFRSTFKAMSFQSLHWLQKLGSCKASVGAKVV